MNRQHIEGIKQSALEKLDGLSEAWKCWVVVMCDELLSQPTLPNLPEGWKGPFAVNAHVCCDVSFTIDDGSGITRLSIQENEQWANCIVAALNAVYPTPEAKKL